MTDHSEGPRTVHLDPSQLPGGARFTAPAIPTLDPSQPAGPGTAPRPRPAPSSEQAPTRRAETQVAQVPAELASRLTSALGESVGAPEATRSQAAPEPGGAPAEAEPLGPRPPVMRRPGPDRTAVYSSMPQPQNRPGWTVEPGWSAYPAAAGGPDVAPPPPDAIPESSPLAGALLANRGAARPQKQPSALRTALTILAVMIVASAVGAGIALVFGDRILDLFNQLTG